MVPRIKATVAWAELDGEIVLYDQNTGSMHLLNPQAGAIWVRVDGVASLGEITADLRDSYQGDQKEIGQDVADFVDRLIAEGVLEEL